MANRPLFVPKSTGPAFVAEVSLEFTWVAGMAASQKRKNVVSLHKAAFQRGYDTVLEISTKSQVPLGEALSAFSLMLDLRGTGKLCVEAAFQGSKVFENGGPYSEFYKMTGREIRADERLRNSGRLLGFDLAGQKWGLEPKTAFYDWLYLTALMQNPALSSQILDFEGFTDIEFNPEKSINCQARTAALFVSIKRRGIFEEVLRSKTDFLNAFNPGQKEKPDVMSQTRLF